MVEDWSHIRQHRFAKDAPPEDWPKGVRPISMEGVSLLGIHEETGKLYWDGHEVITRRVLRLRGYEVVLATVATIAAFGMFVLDLGRTFGWWVSTIPTSGIAP